MGLGNGLEEEKSFVEPFSLGNVVASKPWQALTHNDEPVLFLNPPYADKEKKISKHEHGYLVQYYGSHPWRGYSFLYDHDGKEIEKCFDVETFRMTM